MTDLRREKLEDVAGPVSRETWEALQIFIGEFERWSKRINLAAPSTLNSLFERHVLDSAQLPGSAPSATRWLDLGSGGGFPGVVVAILMKDRQGGWVDLIESNRKKAAFLTSVLGRVEAPARVHALRIESAAGLGITPDCVTARALAPLEVLLELAEPWLQRGARALFHKGREWRREIEESPRAREYDLISRPSVVDPEGVILDIARRRDEKTNTGPAEPVRRIQK